MVCRVGWSGEKENREVGHGVGGYVAEGGEGRRGGGVESGDFEAWRDEAEFGAMDAVGEVVGETTLGVGGVEGCDVEEGGGVGGLGCRSGCVWGHTGFDFLDEEVKGVDGVLEDLWAVGVDHPGGIFAASYDIDSNLANVYHVYPGLENGF
jgi:hypothetical protein